MTHKIGKITTKEKKENQEIHDRQTKPRKQRKGKQRENNDKQVTENNSKENSESNEKWYREIVKGK